MAAVPSPGERRVRGSVLARRLGRGCDWPREKRGLEACLLESSCSRSAAADYSALRAPLLDHLNRVDAPILGHPRTGLQEERLADALGVCVLGDALLAWMPSHSLGAITRVHIRPG